MRGLIPRGLLSLAWGAAALAVVWGTFSPALGQVPAEATPAPPPQAEATLEPGGGAAAEAAEAVEEAGGGAAPEDLLPGIGTPATGWVIDGAGLLPGEVVDRLNVQLADHEARTGNQVVVETVASLGELPVEDVSLDHARRMGIGQKGKDNGVLFLVAPNDRAARIEVGYGLEGVLPDVRASRILRREVVPRFREEDYPGGIEAGVAAILSTLDGSSPPTLLDRLGWLDAVLAWRDSWPRIPIRDQVFLGLFLFLFGPIVSMIAFAWLPWKRVGLALAGLLFLALVVFFVGRYPWMPGGIGLLGLFYLFARNERRIGRFVGAGRGGGGRGGSRSSSGSSGSYSSSSSSSSRSFSGGGGSFGGGGASSRW